MAQQLALDHVPFAWHDLDEIAAEFDRLGLAPDYGGVHDNGATHMAVLGFDDGSYVECIAEHTETDHDFWPEYIGADAGPAAWFVRAPDLVADCKRVLDRGVAVRGPLYGSREREDGTLVEWDHVRYGAGEDRAIYPIAIRDRTPRSYRVSPNGSVAGGPLTGIGQVVLGVDDLDERAERLWEFYRLPRPIRASVDGFGTVASFPGAPLAVATPEGDGWLADRLDRFPDGPCSCLLATDDLDAARREHPLSEPIDWPDGRAAFFESDRLGTRLGVVERD